MNIDNNVLKKVFMAQPVIGLIGQSGCGKETQTRAITSLYKTLVPEGRLFISETGDLYRKKPLHMSPFNQKRLGEIQTAGKLQSWATTIALWGNEFLFNYYGGLIIVDGSPRSILEATAMVDFYYRYAGKQIILFHIHISDEEADKRMLLRNNELALQGKPCRSDSDTPEKRKTKISYFHTDVHPAVQSISEEKGVWVFDIDGMKSIDYVSQTIFTHLAECAPTFV